MRNALVPLQSDRAAGAFEYLLVVGVIVVPTVAAFIAAVALFIPEVVGFVCPAVDTAAPETATVGSCLGF